MKMKTKLFLSLAIGSLVFVSARAGSLEPPPGPVSPTRPPDKCFDNTGNRFVDCGNGTVKDTVTGLFWLKNADCFGGQNWATANIKAAELGHGQCGLTDGSLPGDWRLPTLNCAAFACSLNSATGEFASIFGPACGIAPYVLNNAGTGCWDTANLFSGVQSSRYWSSTTILVYLPLLDLTVAVVDTINGIGAKDIKGNMFHVWPVRGGP